MVYSIARWRLASTVQAAAALTAVVYTGACSVGSSERDGASGGTSGLGGAAGAAGAGGSSGGGAGGSAGTSGSGGDAGIGPDTTAPYVIGFDAGDDKTRAGVRKDANIVISFSEPMDPVATQLAYQSADVPAAAAVLTWDNTGSVLTVDPSAELAYASGANPASVAARKYAFTITTTARDRAGNPLGAPLVAEFTTLRRISHKIVLRATQGTTIAGSGMMYDCPGSFLIGDDTDNRPARGILSFDISALPAGVAEFERATVSGRTQKFIGEPITSLQALLIVHTAFPLPINASARTGAALRVIGSFATSAEPRTSTAVVTAALAEDYENRTQRGNRSQYRLTMQRETDNDATGDAMALHCAADTPPPALDMVYLVP